MTTSERSRDRAASALLVLHACALVAAFFTLAGAFDFPAVLRRPPLEILGRFRVNEALVRGTYIAFTLTGVSFVLMALAVSEALRERAGPWGRVAAVMGTLAGLTQAIGFIRWVWLVPALAAMAVDDGASEARREAAVVVFTALHEFAGVSVGENLSFLFQGLWTFAVGVELRRHLDPRLGAIGMVSGLSFVLYTLEQHGGPFAALGAWNVPFHVVWVAFLALLAARLEKRRRRHPDAPLGRRAYALALLGTGLLFVAVYGGSP